MGYISGYIDFHGCACHLDRFDIHINVLRLLPDELSATKPGEQSAQIRERVTQGRLAQTQRYKGLGIHCNAQLSTKQMKEHCKLGQEEISFLKLASERLSLTARGYDRVLRVARTIADLAGSEMITSAHLAEAVQYRENLMV